MFHQHWVTIPVPEQHTIRGRTIISQQSLDVAVAMSGIMSQLPPYLSNLTCNEGAPEHQCAGLEVPSSLEQVHSIYVNN